MKNNVWSKPVVLGPEHGVIFSNHIDAHNTSEYSMITPGVVWCVECNSIVAVK